MLSFVIREIIMNRLTEILKTKKLLVSDGAWGTYLFKKGLVSGDCPEEWNITHYEDVLDIAKSYVHAGSHIISKNRIGEKIFKLAHNNLSEKLSKICRTSAEISRKAAGEDKIVMASIGPTGKFLVMGDVSSDELYSSFKQQAVAFEEGGADAVCIETFYALDEAEQAVKAVKENTSLDVICTFTFDKTENGLKTLMGITPQQMTESLILCGADVVGANCGSGFEDMVEIVKNIRTASPRIPIIIQANAGLPKIDNGNLIYSETPEKIKEIIPRIIEAGANIIGGCCGTTPEHIKVISEIVRDYNQR